MRRIPLVLLVVLSLIGLASCGDDASAPAPAAPDPDGDSDAGEPDDSGSSGDAVEVPSDFPIPVVDGAVLVIDSLPGIPDGAYLQLLYPGDRYGELVAFYDSWVGEQDSEWTPTLADTSQGAAWLSLSLEGEENYGASINIVAGVGSDDRASVSLISQTVDL